MCSLDVFSTLVNRAEQLSTNEKFVGVICNCILLFVRFFHEDATQEMLDEWRPWLCPFDMLVIGGLQCLELFLPTSLPPELHHKGFK